MSRSTSIITPPPPPPPSQPISIRSFVFHTRDLPPRRRRSSFWVPDLGRRRVMLVCDSCAKTEKQQWLIANRFLSTSAILPPATVPPRCAHVLRRVVKTPRENSLTSRYY
jgi:hypothetical protein